MSKSRGNVVSPATIVDRDGADTARCLHPVHRPARPGRRLVRRGRRGRAPLPRPALAPVGAEAAERAGDPLRTTPQGADLELVRKAHWAIEKVTDDMSRPLRVQHRDRRGHGADERRCSRLRDEATATGALRFALATAVSLLFPFAPHTAADAYDLLTGERVVGGAVARRRPGAARARQLRARLPGQRQGARPRRRRRRARSRTSWRRCAGRRRTCSAHLDGQEVVKEIVVPGKLVNVVVR